MSDNTEIPTEVGSETPPSIGDGDFLLQESGDIEEVVNSNNSDETPVPEEETTTGGVETNPNNENEPPAEGPTNKDVENISKKLALNATNIVKEETTGRTASNEHLRDQMKQPEAPDAEKTLEGKNAQIAVITNNERMEQALRDFIDYINQINGNKKPESTGTKPSETKPDVPSVSEETTNPETVVEEIEVVEGEWVDDTEGTLEDVDEDSEETSIDDGNEEGEVVEGQWRLLQNGILPETIAYFRGDKDVDDDFIENISRNLSDEEFKKFDQIWKQILDKAPSIDSGPFSKYLNTKLETMPKEERETLKEVIKIILRLGVRMGTRVIAFVAREIAKSADKDDKTTKLIFNSIADAADGIESMADSAITGDDKPRRLTTQTRDAVVNFFFRDRNKSES